MNIPLWVWALTLVGLLAVILVDLFLVDRGEPREFTFHQAGFWVCFYVGLAGVFTALLWALRGGQYAGQFAAGYLTEYSLSVDNLFVLYVIMSRFAVPKHSQHKVLLVGILIALVLRGAFIAAGAAVISRFAWVFFLFGVFLVWTAYGLVRSGRGHQAEFKENPLLRWARKVLWTSEGYDGSRIVTRRGGRPAFTTLFIVMVAIGTTDLLFALDSIPAIFGLTTEPFLVFTANAFALMGLRQLYFLLGGLIERLVYLQAGLAFILGFIGVKLILEALHDYRVGWAPQIPIWLSLAVIGATMAVTTAASLVKSHRVALGRTGE